MEMQIYTQKAIMLSANVEQCIIIYGHYFMRQSFYFVFSWFLVLIPHIKSLQLQLGFYSQNHV